MSDKDVAQKRQHDGQNFMMLLTLWCCDHVKALQLFLVSHVRIVGHGTDVKANCKGKAAGGCST